MPFNFRMTMPVLDVTKLLTAVLCLFLSLLPPGHYCFTSVGVSSCDNLLIYLQSCSKSLSLEVVEDIDCTSMSINIVEPIPVLESCTIHGSLDKNRSKKAPTIDWGTQQNLIKVEEGASLTLENMHIKFSNPRPASDGASIPPAIIMGENAQLLMNLVAVSFDVCTDDQEKNGMQPPVDVDLLSLWLSRAATGREGSFYFTEQMDIDHSNGSFSSLCDVGVHCGVRGDDPNAVDRFVEGVTGGASSNTCLSIVKDPESNFFGGESAGALIITTLSVSVVLMLVLLYWVRKNLKLRAASLELELSSSATARQFLSPSGSMRSLVTRDEIRDTPVNIMHDFEQSRPIVEISCTPATTYDPTIHVNPLFLQSNQGGLENNDLLHSEMSRLEQQPNSIRQNLGLEGQRRTETSFHSFDAQLTEDRLCQTTKQISATLFRCGVVMEGGPPILESGFSTVFHKGVYKGEAVTIKIKEENDGLTTTWSLGRGLLQQSDLNHYNLVKVYFAMHGDMFNGELTARDRVAGNIDGDSSLGQNTLTYGCSQRSVLVMEYCDKGTVEEAIGDMVYFHSGPWAMPRMSWILMTGIDVAEAMAYLHSQEVVHGNLNTKNVMMKSDANDPRGLVCKVGNLHGGNMAVSLCNDPGQFRRGRADDVYSFGLFMLELILGNGGTSLQTSRPAEGIDARRPHVPINAPPFYTELLEQCWDVSIDKRPTFEEISRNLKGVLIHYYIETPSPPLTNDSDEVRRSENSFDEYHSFDAMKSSSNRNLLIREHTKENH